MPKIKAPKPERRDIVWAAREMRAGRKVRRPHWSGHMLSRPDGSLLYSLDDMPEGFQNYSRLSLATVELLAEDWEHAQE